jgi:hypothetical protein
VAGLDSLDEPLEEVMTGTTGLVAGFDSLYEVFDTVMMGTMGLVADDTPGTVDMLTLELAGHLDDLEDISGTLGM